MRSLRMSMQTACTAMLRFSPKLSTFSCVFACTSMPPHLSVPASIWDPMDLPHMALLRTAFIHAKKCMLLASP